MSPLDNVSRHLPGTLPGQDDPWRCPACGADQGGPLAQGCQACGSGKPGRKAPVVRAMTPRDFALQWCEEQTVSGDPLRGRPDRSLLVEAFLAGWRMGEQQAAQAQVMGLPPLSAETRTIVAALEMFLDRVLVEADPEEGYLTPAETQELISRLKRGGR